MKIILIIGLGNPGPKYEHTRHNIGFRIIDALAERFAASFIAEERFKSETSAFDHAETRIILVKPQTFMNNSGEAIGLLKKFFKLKNEDILVVHDEVDLPLGKIRLSFDSSSAGHNGVKSVIERIGQDFHRLRVGTDGRQDRTDMDTHDYVLAKFSPEEDAAVEKKIIPAAIAEIEQKILSRS